MDHLIICISSLLSLQVIFIFKSSLFFKSGSSLDPDHLSIWIIMGHHHWIWIITGYHHWIWIIITRYGSSLLDHHHWIWIIITRSGSSLGHHHGCYLLILCIIGTSTEPSLFHDGCIITELVLFHTRCGIYSELVLFHTR